MDGVEAFRGQLQEMPTRDPRLLVSAFGSPVADLLQWTLGDLGEPSGTSGAHECRAPCAGQGPGGLQDKLPWKDLPPHCTDEAPIGGAISCPLEAFGRQVFYKCQFSFDFTRR